jgi:hypothetical protein
MNKILFAISFLFIFSLQSCTKNVDKKWTVHYQMLNLANEIPVYRLTYLLPNGSSKTVGPISTYNWKSEDLPEFKSGSHVSLQIEIISGTGHYQVEILRDGAVYKTENLLKGTPSFYIEDVI